MPRRLIHNFFVHAFLMSAALYAILIATVPQNFLIPLFNGVFVGMSLSVTLIYWPIIKTAVWPKQRTSEDKFYYDRDDEDVKVYAVSALLLWIAFVIMKLLGVASAVAGREPWWIAAPYSLFATYLAILAALGQIAAPSLGHSVGIRTDKKLVYVALGSGLLLAIVVVIVQLLQPLN